MPPSTVTLNLLLALISVHCTSGKYEPTWESIDSRPLPEWYDDAKLGIIIHWGVFAVQSFTSEWAWYYWRAKNNEQDLQWIEYGFTLKLRKRKKKNEDFVRYMKRYYPQDFTYQDFAKDFTAELYNPDQWAKIINASGARYVVLTSKHHEGYAMWPSKYSFSWNSMDVGPKRDLVGELKAAFRNYTDIKFGLYHSFFEWYNPLHQADEAKNFTNLDAVNFVDSKVFPEMIELVERYQPEVFWSDGDEGPPSSYWKSTQFLAWLYNESPVKHTVVVNDRWGAGTGCKHGGFFTCQDRYNPGKLQNRKWENAFTIDKESWGYRRTANLADYLSISEIIETLTRTVSFGGNALINIGPTKDGVIAPIYEERLVQLGQWMKVNGEAVYSSRPWTVCQNDTLTPGIWYTTNKDKTVLYATFSPWPVDNIVKMSCPEFTHETEIRLLGLGGKLSHSQMVATASRQVVEVRLPDKARVSTEWVWTLKMKHVKNMVGSY